MIRSLCFLKRVESKGHEKKAFHVFEPKESRFRAPILSQTKTLFYSKSSRKNWFCGACRSMSESLCRRTRGEIHKPSRLLWCAPCWGGPGFRLRETFWRRDPDFRRQDLQQILDIALHFAGPSLRASWVGSIASDRRNSYDWFRILRLSFGGNKRMPRIPRIFLNTSF